jgi:phosphatidate cytidylyltransferase
MLKTRIFTAAVLLAVFIPAMFRLPPTYWAGLMALVAAVAAWEWGALAGLSTVGRYVFGGVQLLLLLLCVRLYGADYRILAWDGYYGYNGTDWILCAAAAFWCLIVPLWLWRRWSLRKSLWGRCLLLCLGLFLILAAWMSFVILRNDYPASPKELLWLIGIVCVSDTSAYFTGRLFGGKKLAPNISPGKTWAGVFGALVGVVIYGILTFPLMEIQGSFLPFLLILAVLGILGDLFESLLKRQADVKDSGNILPGHGGVLDRIDSLIAVLPSALPLIALMPL